MSTIGQRIKHARQLKRLTQQQLADHFKISRVSVTQWESDTTKPESDKFTELARLLGGSPEWYLDGTGVGIVSKRLEDSKVYQMAEAELVARRPKPNASFPPRYQQFPESGVPLMGQTQGGPNGRFVMNGQASKIVFCPPDLEGVEGAYAVQVHGVSMEPKFEAGETVWLNPHAPVRRGDYVVVQIQDRDDGEELSSYIKQFISRGSGRLRLKQFNPEEGETEELEFPDDLVFSVHKIVFHALA